MVNIISVISKAARFKLNGFELSWSQSLGSFGFTLSSEECQNISFVLVCFEFSFENRNVNLRIGKNHMGQWAGDVGSMWGQYRADVVSM